MDTKYKFSCCGVDVAKSCIAMKGVIYAYSTVKWFLNFNVNKISGLCVHADLK